MDRGTDSVMGFSCNSNDGADKSASIRHAVGIFSISIRSNKLVIMKFKRPAETNLVYLMHLVYELCSPKEPWASFRNTN